MSTLFLDFDGVLNSVEWFERICVADPHGPVRDMGGLLRKFDPRAIMYLNQIVEETGCDVVLSTTWRGGGNRTLHVLDLAGFEHGGRIVGATPVHEVDRGKQLNDPECDSQRGDEILEYMKQNWDKDYRYCVLDDEDDMRGVGAWHVWVDGKYGLQRKHVDEAVELLGRKDD